MRVALALALALTACSGAAAPAPAPVALEADPAVALDVLEAQLLGARRVRLEAELEVRGPTAARLRVRLDVEREVAASLEVRGEVGGSPVEARWRSATAAARDTPSPVWAEALVLGVVRAGLADTVAPVLAGDDPARWIDGVVSVADVAWRGAAAGRTLAFAVRRHAVPVAAAELTLDARALPAGRTQRAADDDGAQVVFERYRRFVVEP